MNQTIYEEYALDIRSASGCSMVERSLEKQLPSLIAVGQFFRREMPMTWRLPSRIP